MMNAETTEKLRTGLTTLDDRIADWISVTPADVQRILKAIENMLALLSPAPQPEPAPGPYMVLRAMDCDANPTWFIEDVSGRIVASHILDEPTARLLASAWSKDKENKAARELLVLCREYFKSMRLGLGLDKDIDAFFAEHPA